MATNITYDGTTSLNDYLLQFELVGELNLNQFEVGEMIRSSNKGRTTMTSPVTELTQKRDCKKLAVKLTGQDIPSLGMLGKL